MTVAELLEKLKEFPQDADVYIAAPERGGFKAEGVQLDGPEHGEPYAGTVCIFATD